MASNEYVNKVVFGNDTLIDLSADTVAADKVLSGYTAHSASGAPITGSIAQRSYEDISFNEEIKGAASKRIYVITTAPAGYYPQGIMSGTSTVYLPIPSSGEAVFTVQIPNGTLNPNKNNPDDWIVLDISIDSNGNSNITKDATNAYGVSY